MLDSIFTQFDRVVVLDTETTGIDCRRDEIIELAAVAVSPDGVEDEMDLLIRLTPGRRLPPMITELTGITEQMLAAEGVEKLQAAERFAAMLQAPRTMIAAFNAQFDFTFLYFYLARLGMADCLKNLGMLDILTVYKDRRPYPHKLKNAIESYGVAAENSHRAVDDAMAALLVLEAMREENDDLMQYRNLFGFNPKYGVSGPRIGSIHYAPQKYDPQLPLYALYAHV